MKDSQFKKAINDYIRESKENACVLAVVTKLKPGPEEKWVDETYDVFHCEDSEYCSRDTAASSVAALINTLAREYGCEDPRDFFEEIYEEFLSFIEEEDR